jgi:hypothetical protein
MACKKRGAITRGSDGPAFGGVHQKRYFEGDHSEVKF